MSATVRCFVALWPDDAARSSIVQIAAAEHARWPAARLMRSENLHLTLAFIGVLPVEVVRRLQPIIDALTSPAFDWTLDRLGVFRSARVLWIGGPACPPLHALAHTVRATLDAQRVAYDHKPFVPHITLLRDLPRLAQPATTIAALLWPVRAPRLVVSTMTPAGVCYRDAAQVL
jgi:RNA 2',3'-cyclic 3'-phosphodiesterase